MVGPEEFVLWKLLTIAHITWPGHCRPHRRMLVLRLNSSYSLNLIHFIPKMVLTYRIFTSHYGSNFRTTSSLGSVLFSDTILMS